MVDEKRVEELIAKRKDVGLSDDEADELGRLFAEREGKPYSNAKGLKWRGSSCRWVREVKRT